MKNLFLKGKVLVVGILIMFLGFGISFTKADVTTNFWAQTAANVLMTNTSGGRATADIHVAHCYIGTGTGTPCSGGGGGGTVTSVGLALPNIFTVSGSPVTGSGTLTGSLVSQSQNLVFASPNGSSGTPTFRTLVAADLPAGTGTLTSLNGLTTAVQTFATGTAGTDFGIVSSGSTHTFNIPDASATARGLVTTGTQTFAGSKTFSNIPTITPFSTAGVVHNNASGLLSSSLIVAADITNGTITNANLANSTIGLTLGTTGTDVGVTGSPAALGGALTLNIPTASATNRGALSSTDWTTFNNKIGGSGTTNQLAWFSSSSAITSSANISRTAWSLVVDDQLTNMVIGLGAGTSGIVGIGDTVLGNSAGASLANASGATLVGTGAGSSITTGGSDIGIGRASLASCITCSNSISIGSSTATSSALASTITLGNGAISTASNQFLVGSPTNKISDVIFGSGATSASITSNLTFGSSGGSGTDVAGQNMRIRPGAGTGTGVGGKFQVDIALPGSTGSTANSYSTMLLVDATGLTTLSQSLALTPVGTGTGQTGELRSFELVANGANYTGFKAPDALAGNVIYKLPIADGTSGQILSTNGSGALAWATGAAGTVTGTGTNGQVTYWTGASSTSGDGNFLWAPSTKRFRVGDIANSGNKTILNVLDDSKAIQATAPLGTVQLGDPSGLGNSTLFQLDDVGQTMTFSASSTEMTINTQGVTIPRGYFTPPTLYNFGATLTSDQQVILESTGPSPSTITLPANPFDGERHTIKDYAGNASANNITIDGNGHSIDNASTFIMNIDWQSTEVIYSTNNGIWYVI